MMAVAKSYSEDKAAAVMTMESPKAVEEKRDRARPYERTAHKMWRQASCDSLG